MDIDTNILMHSSDSTDKNNNNNNNTTSLKPVTAPYKPVHHNNATPIQSPDYIEITDSPPPQPLNYSPDFSDDEDYTPADHATAFTPPPAYITEETRIYIQLPNSPQNTAIIMEIDDASTQTDMDNTPRPNTSNSQDTSQADPLIKIKVNVGGYNMELSDIPMEQVPRMMEQIMKGASKQK